MATGINTCLTKDGQNVATANLPMGTFLHTNVGEATARNQYARTSQVQDSAFTWLGTAGGTADVITASLTPIITAYAAGQNFRFISSGANTTNVTLNINAVGAKAVTKRGATALIAGDIPSGAVIQVTYDGTQFQLTAIVFTATAFGQSLMDDADATAGRATLGIGTAGPSDLASDAVALAGTSATALAPVAVAGGWLGRALVPGGRLSLTTGLAVTTADVTGAGTVYYALYTDNLVPCWNGTRWQVSSFAQLSIVLEAAQQTSGNNYDLFLFDLAGAITLGTGPAWTNSTTRADALGAKDGRWTNNASITIRTNGANNTVAANLALYVGTMRMTGNAQTEDSLKKRFLWNSYNRVNRAMRNATETTDTWAYATAVWRQANANAANQLDFVVGLNEDMVTASALGVCRNSNTQMTYTGIGLDLTNAIATDSNPGVASGNSVATDYSMTSSYRGYPGLGRHFLSWLEYANAGATTATWSGDGGNAALYQSGISGELRG